MLGGIFDKAILATISLGMMLFSSYQGNTPSFENVGADTQGSRLTVQSHLSSAFNEDFKQIMQSGQEIAIQFTLTLEDNYSTEILSFEHRSTYDPLSGIWTLICEESSSAPMYIETWSEFKNANSLFNYKGIHDLALPVKVDLIASLPKIILGNNGKSFDLMIFWNYHKPNCHADIE